MSKEESVRKVLLEVYSSLQKYGYHPVNQIVGYLLSEDPTYITSKEKARVKMQKLEREDIIEEIVRCYLEKI